MRSSLKKGGCYDRSTTEREVCPIVTRMPAAIIEQSDLLSIENRQRIVKFARFIYPV